MTPTKSWKSFELRIAKLLGGKRRGADTRGENAGKSDIILPGWSIECKLLKNVYWSSLVGAILQAERNRSNPNEIPIAIVKQLMSRDKDSIVAMRLETFLEFFMNVQEKKDHE